MSNLSKIRFTSVFLTQEIKKIMDQKSDPESKKMSFFEEAMTIFQKIGF